MGFGLGVSFTSTLRDTIATCILNFLLSSSIIDVSNVLVIYRPERVNNHFSCIKSVVFLHLTQQYLDIVNHFLTSHLNHTSLQTDSYKALWRFVQSNEYQRNTTKSVTSGQHFIWDDTVFPFILFNSTDCSSSTFDLVQRLSSSNLHAWNHVE